MPLRHKCQGCARHLQLEDVFQGAYCRCQFCRTLCAVPRNPVLATKRPSTRPDRPAFIGERVSPAVQTRRPTEKQGWVAAFPILAKVGSHRTITAMSVVLATSLGVAVWTANTPDHDDRTPIEMLSNPTPEDLAVATANPLLTYFGVPLKGQTIGYVVDCDSTMANYIDQVAFITDQVNTAIDPTERRFGIVQAINDPDGNHITEIVEPTSDLEGAKSTLQGRLAGGTTDLARALSVTKRWYADQMFIVLSKRLEDTEVQLLTQHAQQTGATTHVIALGDAASQTSLSSISSATGGKFVQVDDDLLKSVVKSHEDAIGG